MNTHHCPCCELVFEHRTVLEYHLRNDHPKVHFDYPVSAKSEEEWPRVSEPRRYTWRPTYPMRHVP